MPREKADFAWYSSQSSKQKLPFRCPIARADLCPRFFWSLEALTVSRHFTEIPRETAAHLAKKWEIFHAQMDEDKPWTVDESHRDKTDSRAPLNIVAHFCPEVSFNRFGYFASDLIGYYGADSDERSDEREREFSSYEREGIRDQFDGSWRKVTPRHYSECSEFSLYSGFASGKGASKTGQRGSITPKRRFEVLARDNFTCVYCGRRPPEVVLHVEHKVSVHDGGTDDVSNLVTACQECNLGKGITSL